MAARPSLHAVVLPASPLEPRPYRGPARLRFVWPLAGPFGALLLAAMAITTLH